MVRNIQRDTKFISKGKESGYSGVYVKPIVDVEERIVRLLHQQNEWDNPWLELESAGNKKDIRKFIILLVAALPQNHRHEHQQRLKQFKKFL
jgi:hypothetical protein